MDHQESINVEALCAPCRVLLTDPFTLPDPKDNKVGQYPRRRLHNVGEFKACACPMCKLVIHNMQPSHISSLECTSEGLVGRCDHPRGDGTFSLMVQRPCDVDEPHGYDARAEVSFLVDFEAKRIVASQGNVLQNLVPSIFTGADICFAQVEQWLSDCADHAVCTNWHQMTGFTRQCPTRLLDLDIGSESPVLKLVPGQDIDHDAVRYATLSHSWGGGISTRLLKENVDSFLSAIPLSTLPKTFREVVTAARKLAIPYLWIDALCIIQDSREDWLQQAALMGEYYAGSVLNFSATASSSSEGGLFRERNPHKLQTIALHSDQVKDVRLVIYNDLWNEEVPFAHINTRAWVVQERYLAPRVVHFGQSQLYWECTTMLTSEFLPLGFTIADVVLSTKGPQALHSMRSTDPWAILKLWDDVVLAYTCSNITFASDRAVAISGLARVFCHYLGLQPYDYVYGLWKPYFVTGLLWAYDDDVPNDNGKKALLEFPEDISKTCAPTWSWISWGKAVNSFHCAPQWGDFSPDSGFQYRVIAQVLDAHTSTVVQPFGDISSACIRLRGPLCKLKRDEYFDWWIGGSRLWQASYSWTPQEYPDSDDEDFDEDEITDRFLELDVYALLLAVANGSEAARGDPENEYRPFYGGTQYEFLLLVPTGAAQGQFRRIGCGPLVDGDKPFGVCESCDETLRSFDVPEDMYEAVDDDFMYTITLI